MDMLWVKYRPPAASAATSSAAGIAIFFFMAMNSCAENDLLQQPVWLGMVRHGKGVVAAGEATSGDVTAGMTGVTAAGAIGSGIADVIGTAAAPLTPSVPTSVDASGIPVLETPPATSGVVAVAVEIGVEEDARLPEPA